MIGVVCNDILSWTACYTMTISRMKCNGKAVFYLDPMGGVNIGRRGHRRHYDNQQFSKRFITV